MFIAGVIGYPLRLTYSPILHNYAFKKLHIEGRYYPLCVAPADLGIFFDSLRKLDFAGLNITNPYKISSLDYVDRTSLIAREVGAINTVVVDNNCLLGENTDVYGYYESLRENKIRLRNKRVLLIGAGGVARACAYVLKRERPAEILVANRTFENTLKVVEICKAKAIEFDLIYDFVAEVDMVVNATSTDLYNTIVPKLRPGSIYYDTNYCFSLKRYKGIKVVNGFCMLVIQAAYSFSLWTGIKPPVNIMEKALKEVRCD